MTTPTQPNPGEVLTGESVGETPLGIALEALIRLATGTERTFNASSARQMAASTTAIAADAMNRIASLRLSLPAPDAEGDYELPILSEGVPVRDPEIPDTPPPAAPDDGGPEVVGQVVKGRSRDAVFVPNDGRSITLSDSCVVTPVVTLAQAQAAVAAKELEWARWADEKICEAQASELAAKTALDAAEARAEGYREALERARSFIDACAAEGELTPNDTAENPCEVVNAIDQALTAHQTAGS